MPYKIAPFFIRSGATLYVAVAWEIIDAFIGYSDLEATAPAR